MHATYLLVPPKYLLQLSTALVLLVITDTEKHSERANLRLA